MNEKQVENTESKKNEDEEISLIGHCETLSVNLQNGRLVVN